MELSVKLLENEYWWGINSLLGKNMPFSANTVLRGSILQNTWSDKAVPFLISNKGRYIYCKGGFDYSLKAGVFYISSQNAQPIVCTAGFNLSDAYNVVINRYYPPKGSPPKAFFSSPQYNTWIELLYNQNQTDILNYAKSIKKSGMPAGVLMIDDGWMNDYGSWNFKYNAFSDPKQMSDELHELGFKLMLWVCPYISPDSSEYRLLYKNGGLIRTRKNEAKLVSWWNGYSAVLDMTNPVDVSWFDAQLKLLMNEYGIDGFKFDAGDVNAYSYDDVTYSPVTPNEHCRLYSEFASHYSYNEIRACYECVGYPIIQRIGDKPHDWKNGLQQLIPCGLAQSMLGYAYSCPDMVGGGAIGYVDKDKLDFELTVRYAQCSALFPMMQFSLSVWRLLPQKYAQMCIDAVSLRQRFLEDILQAVNFATKLGEPIIRPMEYNFPNDGLAQITDQFMLGKTLLVAPVLEKGAVERSVWFPQGIWIDEYGTVIQGPCKRRIKAPIERLPVFRLKD